MRFFGSSLFFLYVVHCLELHAWGKVNQLQLIQVCMYPCKRVVSRT